MAIQKAVFDPYSGRQVPATEAVHRVSEINLNFTDEVGRVTLLSWRSAKAQQDKAPPIGGFVFDLGPESRPETRDAEGNVLAPAFPSFREFVTANPLVFAAAKAAIYQFAIAQTKALQGGKEV